MAKKSAIDKNQKRQKLVKQGQAKRDQLRETIKKDPDPEKRDEAELKLQKRKRDESKIRLRNRCRMCGRPNGTLRKFGLCRIHLREAAMRGDVPGLKKASW